MAYRLTRRAEADVIEIFVNGAERFGLEHAEAYHSALERTSSRSSPCTRVWLKSARRSCRRYAFIPRERT
jgi:hypothetical protein